MNWEEALPKLIPALQARANVMLQGRYHGSGTPLAADLAQATLVKLREAGAAERFADATFERIRAYAFRVLHNHYIDTCHRKHREALAESAEAPVEETSGPHPLSDGAHTPEEAVIVQEERRRRDQQLRAALSILTEPERTFLSAVMRSGSAPAAQKETGWPPGTASNACQKRNAILLKLSAHVVANSTEKKGGQK